MQKQVPGSGVSDMGSLVLGYWFEGRVKRYVGVLSATGLLWWLGRIIVSVMRNLRSFPKFLYVRAKFAG